MLDVSWVDEQIERVRCATATMQTARDFALLCIARDHLADMDRERSRVTASDAPTLEQIEAALATITVTTEDERRRADDAKLWARTLGGK